MKFKLLTITLLIFSSLSSAKDISGSPPVDLLLLEFTKVLEGEAHAGAHGLKEYCYKVGAAYVVYSQNLLGEGYSFLTEKPNQECTISTNKISKTNKMGLTIGVTQQRASSLLGIELSEGINEIVWHYQRPIHNLPYDDQTTLNVIIKNGKVYAVSLFNTVTS